MRSPMHLVARWRGRAGWACTRVTLAGSTANRASRRRPGSSTSKSGVPAIATQTFLYELPEALIAREPTEPRDACRLLVSLPETWGSNGVSSSQLADKTFSDLDELLPPRTHLVMNHSAVFAARLKAWPPSGSRQHRPVEVMVLSPEPPERDPSIALSQPAHGQCWRAMVRMPLQTAGLRLMAEPYTPSTRAVDNESLGRWEVQVDRLLGKWEEEGEEQGVEAVIRFAHASDDAVTARGTQPTSTGIDASACPQSIPLREVFDALGETPLPPYMRRDARAEDAAAYQTVYASSAQLGSVAAPTAGLHFTHRLLGRLDSRAVRRSQWAERPSRRTQRQARVACAPLVAFARCSLAFPL